MQKKKKGRNGGKHKKDVVKRAVVVVTEQTGYDKKAKYQERKAAFDKMKNTFREADTDGDGCVVLLKLVVVYRYPDVSALSY
jgi:hypothetical protein